ncbi:MAG: D-aminoacyl-tRNA deacylase [Paracoccaceae bacterium]
MRALIQRVTNASVTVDGITIGKIGPGLLILICAMPTDTETTAESLALKISKLRIFADDQGRMNRALKDTGGHALVVSQFTLAADTSRGNRPGFSSAAKPELARALTDHFTAALVALNIQTETGQFGADMAVTLTNDGPVTIWLDTET